MANIRQRVVDQDMSAGSCSQQQHTFNRVLKLLGQTLDTLETDRSTARVCLSEAVAVLRGESATAERVGRITAATMPLQLCRWQVETVTRYIRQNLASKPSVKMLAAIANLSPSYFARVFHSTVGCAPGAYARRLRLEVARDLLQGSEKPIRDIALECGFTDQAHLCRCFRRANGISPAKWRRVHQIPVFLSQQPVIGAQLLRPLLPQVRADARG